jgi:dephospho-CoA kinase
LGRNSRSSSTLGYLDFFRYQSSFKGGPGEERQCGPGAAGFWPGGRVDDRPASDGTAVSLRKPVVGLAGGIGSGKSTVARILEELGAGVIDSDLLAREEMATKEVRDTLARWWGRDILTAEGLLDRQKIASRVFSEPAQRQRLEALVHPRVAARREARLAELMADPRIKLVVLDSPLLFETGLDKSCDAVIFVERSLAARAAGSEKERGWPRGEIERREKNQQPLDTKRSRADHTCDNNSTIPNLRTQVERIFNQVLSEFDSPQQRSSP